ncbi:MAG: hypothetical protein IT176_14475 [Acidobacteria bacterium]|nr:hypothetical protein [Acidobacteriota bacterium]
MMYAGAAGIAAAAAALFAWSPLGVACGALIAAMTWRATSRWEGVERRWVGGALIAGTLLRALCVLALFLMTGPQEQFNVLFGDGRFAVDRSIWILNEASGIPIAPFYWMRVSQNYGDVQYHYALAVVQWFFGPSPYALGLINVACYEVFAIVFHRLMRRAFGAAAAGAALLLLMFWPTIFVWTFSMLKESLQFGLAVAAMACAVGTTRAGSTGRRLAWAAGGVASLVALTELRPGSSLMAGGAIAFGVAAFAATRRTWLALAAAALARAAVYGAAAQPAVRAQALSQTRIALVRHVGHVKSSGISYRAADERFYRGERLVPFTMEPSEGVRFLLLSAFYFFAAPLPQHIASTSGTLFLPLQFAWYALLLLMLAGIPEALRRDPLVTWLSIGYVLTGLVTIAPNSGNIGTLIRHRDMVVPFVIGLGSVGFVGLLARMTRHVPD